MPPARALDPTPTREEVDIMSPIMPHTASETEPPVRVVTVDGERELNTLIDSLVEELRVPVEILVVNDPYLEGLVAALDGALPELPAWSPTTEALVAEYTARTGGAQ
jgi:hypothetical protein